MILVILIIIGLIIFAKSTYSKGEKIYKESYIYEGDTLWSIAKEESSTNKYFEGKDIREIIFEIRKVNNNSLDNLSIGEKILIPEYK